MAVQFINVESSFFLRKFIRPKNPLSTARIAHFVFLRQSTKNMAAKFKGHAHFRTKYPRTLCYHSNRIYVEPRVVVSIFVLKSQQYRQYFSFKRFFESLREFTCITV